MRRTHRYHQRIEERVAELGAQHFAGAMRGAACDASLDPDGHAIQPVRAEGTERDGDDPGAQKPPRMMRDGVAEALEWITHADTGVWPVCSPFQRI